MDAEGVSPCAACAVRDMAFCGVLNDEELPRLLSIFNTVEIDPHQPIIDEGEAADYLFNVTDGAVKLYKLLPDGRRQITGFLFSGDFLGIAMNEKYAYSAEAVGNVSLCRFPRRKLEALLDEFPKLEKRLLGMASNELVQAQDQILLLGRKTAQEKIVSFLLSLSERAVKRGSDPSPIALPMGRADIADYLGLTTETVSRTITNLKRDGLIRLLHGGRVELPDLAALRDLADGS
ncbi:MAG: helix-turn-helix domain-containing protein [Alphaproteobacteria bacterium]|nr:helix-turn-helix domain-containing protein [Alphaproteobacteria bacterium]